MEEFDKGKFEWHSLQEDSQRYLSVCRAPNPAKRFVETVVARLDSDADKAVRDVSIDIVTTWEKSCVSRCWLHSCLMMDTVLCLEIYLRIKSLQSLPCGA